jgi:ribosome-associated protein
MTDVAPTEGLRLAAMIAADKKAFQIVGYEISKLTSYADQLLICSGASERQVGAIADAVNRQLRDTGLRPLHIEGASGSDWVLMDYGDFVIHVFTEERRSYYGLDALWGDAPRIDGVAGDLPADPSS